MKAANALCSDKKQERQFQQDTELIGHADFDTTMNVYTDATKDFKLQEFRELDRLISNSGSFEKSDE